MLICPFVCDVRKFYEGYIQKIKEMGMVAHKVNFREESSEPIGFISSTIVDDGTFELCACIPAYTHMMANT